MASTFNIGNVLSSLGQLSGLLCVVELGGPEGDKFHACPHEWNWQINRPRIIHRANQKLTIKRTSRPSQNTSPSGLSQAQFEFTGCKSKLRLAPARGCFKKTYLVRLFLKRCKLQSLVEVGYPLFCHIVKSRARFVHLCEKRTHTSYRIPVREWKQMIMLQLFP